MTYTELKNRISKELDNIQAVVSKIVADAKEGKTECVGMAELLNLT